MGHVILKCALLLLWVRGVVGSILQIKASMSFLYVKWLCHKDTLTLFFTLS